MNSNTFFCFGQQRLLISPYEDIVFLNTIHQSVQSNSWLQGGGRQYIVLENGVASLTSKKSKEVSYKVLAALVTQRLNRLTVWDQIKVKLDLAIMKERQENSRFEICDDLFRQTFGFLGLKEIGRATAVSSSWQSTIGSLDQDVWQFPLKKAMEEMTFGPEKWKAYGDVGKVPSLPNKIFQILTSPCPYWPKKKVFQTHILVLVPKTVNGEPTTLRALRGLLSNAREPNKLEYHSHDLIFGEEGNTPINASYWALVTKELVPGSQDQNQHATPRNLVKGVESYGVPDLLTATVAVLMQFLNTGLNRFGNRSGYAYSYCQESLGGVLTSVVGFGAEGPGIYNLDCHHCRCDNVGVLAMRRF
jgi:hypothetical protein